MRIVIVTIIAGALGAGIPAIPVRSAKAQPRSDDLTRVREDAREDVANEGDGEFDSADEVAPATLPGRRASARPPGGRAENWVSLAGIHRSSEGGKSDVGAMLVLNLALDPLAVALGGRAPREADELPRIAGGSIAGGSPGPATSSSASQRWPHAGFARQCVAAAWRASGLGVSDGRIDSLASRSRSSALLPETRIRALRRWDDANRSTTLGATDTTNNFASVGANLAIELRLTWRLERLIFADEEPAIERLRLDRQEARSRLASRTLEELFAWKRSRLERARAAEGSDDAAEAELRVAQAAEALDVLTAGWFSARLFERDGTD